MRAVFSFSLWCLLALVAFGGTATETLVGVGRAKSDKAKIAAVEGYLQEYENDALFQALEDIHENRVSSGKGLIKCQEILQELATIERMKPVPSAATQAKEIKRGVLFVDNPKQESNWLQNALRRLKNLKWDWPKSKTTDQLPTAALGNFFIYGMWGLLGIGLLVFAFFAIRFIRLNLKLRKRDHQILDEEEEIASLDEWLQRADEFERRGEYRLAVRALYVACLLSFDRALVARFDRGQTNWEHLQRIQTSPRRPADLNFLPPTQRFDLVWYGNHVRGAEDVAELRSAYLRVTELLRGVAA